MSLLELNEVTQTYRGGSPLHPRVVRAVRGVNIEVEQGECLAIVGESGSGKSTLLRMIAGLEAPASGSIRFQDKPVTPRTMRGYRRHAVQMVYQNSFEATNPRFTALQVVSEPLQYFRLASKSEQRHTVAALLGQVGIPEVEADKKVYEFSGGQLQRICIARALAAQPEVLLLDEPLSSLDVSVRAQILNLLRDLQEELGLTYVLISHDLEMVYNLADHLAILFAGTLVEEITDLKYFSSLCHPYTKLLLAPVIAPAESPVQTVPEGEAGCVYIHRCPNTCDRCRTEAPALRELSSGHRVACHLAAL